MYLGYSTKENLLGSDTTKPVTVIGKVHAFTIVKLPESTIPSLHSIRQSANASLINGVGNFTRGEVVKGLSSGVEARVKEWDTDTKILKISNVGIGTTTKAFLPGEIIQATESLFFKSDSIISGTIGVTTTLITGINTSNISLNQELDQVKFGQTIVIGTGATVTSIGAGTINISVVSLNTTGVTTSISFGSTVFSNYALDFFSQENQDTTFESNEIIESEADDIIDFSEGNPFGTF